MYSINEGYFVDVYLLIKKSHAIPLRNNVEYRMKISHEVNILNREIRKSKKET